MTRKTSVTLGLITFIITLLVTVSIAAYYIRVTSNSRKERAQFIANSVSDRIEAEIDTREFITRVFEITVSGNNGEISDKEFQNIASELFDEYIDIVDIAIAPAGTVSSVYPDTSGLKAGMSFFSDELYGVYADYSKLSKVPVIIAPVELIDGATGIIIRRPIFLDDGSFWGFASVAINLGSFLQEVDINALASGNYEYRLLSNSAITGEDSVITEFIEKNIAVPCSSMISTVGGGYWTLMIAPRLGWMQLYEIIAVLMIAFIISVLAAMFMYAYMSMKANAKELEVLSYRDALTNLYNPRSYQEHMDELSKKKLPYGLVFMDLNDFKQVNDTHGHEVGDALLNITAKRLQNSIREKDKAFRIGGDEFVVVLHGAHDKKFYEGVINRMRENVAREVVVGDITLNVTISAGYARCPEDGTKLEDVVKKADEAMYYNKRLHKARKAQMQGDSVNTTSR